MQPDQPAYECPAGHECPGYSEADVDAAYQRGEGTAFHRVAAYASHRLGNAPDNVEPIPAEVVAVVDMVMTVSREQGIVEGRRQAAAAIRAADTSGWPGGRSGDVDGCQELAAEIAGGPDA